jgi:hypothetical protein
MKTYWIDADIDGTPRISDWQAKNIGEAVQKLKEYYQTKGIPSQDIIIRKVKIEK